MPRQQRKTSKTSIYHIMLRGNERKKIFELDEEKQRLLEDFTIKQKEIGFSIYAYCVMDNHVHIVINSQEKDISTIMKGIAIRYAFYYNTQHNRVGHVFQDRFKSESIEDERYLMAVIRYIHNNPVKAKMVEKPEDYAWSSYPLFIDLYGSSSSLACGLVLDTQNIFGIIARDRQTAIAEFIRFSAEEDLGSYLDCDDERAVRTLEQGSQYFQEYLTRKHRGVPWEELKQNAAIKKEVIRHLRTETELSIRTISKLLGIDRNMIERIWN